MKVYTYNKTAFFMQVKFTGIFCLGVAVIALISAISGYLSGLMVFISVVALYQVWNTFVSHSNPEQVILDDDTITFASFQKEDRYVVSEMKQLRIREFPSSGKMYIRIDDANLFHGRYWIQSSQFNDGKELFKALLDIEYKKHPDTLKARARSVNTEYINAGVSRNGTKKKRQRKMIRVGK